MNPLGQGGMGTVYAAQDLRSDRVVALKLLRGVTGQTVFRLKNEFRTLTELQHRNIIVPYELFFHDDLLCYSMELVHGETIVEDTRRAGNRSARLRETLLQLTDALDVVHGRGIIHRDLKPENILVTEEGRVVLLDFGIAKTLSDTLTSGITMERAWLGTPAYMAPEQFKSASASVATDLYALGAVIYECATGRQAFPQSTVTEMLHAKRHRELPTLEGLGELGTVTLELLDPNPELRPSARRVRDLLGEGVTSSPVELRTESFTVGRRAESKRLLDAATTAAQTRRVQLAALTGQSGVGKTHILDSFAVKARGRGAFVASARCSTLENLPLRVIDGLLDDIISQSRTDGRVPIERCYPRHATSVRALFPCTAVLFGEDPGPAANSDSEGERELGLRGVCDFLARLAEHVPLVLCFDDLHRSDEDGLDALLRLVLELGECPVTFVFSCTTSAAGDDTTVERFFERCQQHAGGHQSLERIELGPLPTEQLVAIAWNELGSWSGPGTVVETLCEESAGNPGTCVWYARVLRGEDPDAFADEHPPAEGSTGLDARIFGRAWGRLTDDGRSLLTFLSLAGGELPRTALRRLLGADDRVDAALRELEHAGFLRRYRYTSSASVCVWHDKLTSEVLALTDDAAVQQAHAGLAEAFASISVHGRAAYHARARGDDDTALAQYAIAADAARRGHAHRRAIEFLRAALELSQQDDPARIEVDLADSLSRVGHLREAAELCVRRAGTAPSRSDASTLRTQAIGLYGSLAEVDRVRALLLEAEATPKPVPSSNGALLARLIGLRLKLWARPPWKAQAPSQSPERAADRLDALWTAGSRLLHVDPIFAATAASEHLRLAFLTDDVAHQARALAFEAVVMTSSGEKRLTEASTLLAAAERRAYQSGDPVVRAFVHQGAGFMWGNVARYREAIVEGRRCIQCLEEAANPPAYEVGHAHVELGWRLMVLGELAELLCTVPPVLRHAIDCEDPVLTTAFEVQLAMAHLAADRPEEARLHLERGSKWCPPSYEVGHFGLFNAKLAVALYEDDLDTVADIVSRERAEVEKLRVIRLPAVRAIYRYRVGSILLRLLEAGKHPAPQIARRELRKIRRQLAREAFGVGIAHARLLEAGWQSLEGQSFLALGFLREAVDRFASLGWDNLAALAKVRYLELQRAPEEPELEEQLRRFGVRSPSRWARAMLPRLRGPQDDTP